MLVSLNHFYCLLKAEKLNKTVTGRFVFLIFVFNYPFCR